ncbi:MAG: hypothetical protein R3C02_15065 [Planctomycetaceae bacterium]
MMKVPLKPSRSSKLTTVLLLLACGFLIGRSTFDSSIVQADVRETPRREAFQSGDERSVAILNEISSTLKRIDGRLERLERAIPQFKTSSQ